MKNVSKNNFNDESFDGSSNFLKQTQIKNDLNYWNQYEKDNYMTIINEKLHLSDRIFIFII